MSRVFIKPASSPINLSLAHVPQAPMGSRAIEVGFSVQLGPSQTPGMRFVAVSPARDRQQIRDQEPRELQVRVVSTEGHKFAGPNVASEAQQHVDRLRADSRYQGMNISAEFNGPGMVVHDRNPWN